MIEEWDTHTGMCGEAKLRREGSEDAYPGLSAERGPVTPWLGRRGFDSRHHQRTKHAILTCHERLN